MTSIATFHHTAHSLVFTLLLLLLRHESQNFVWAAPALGRATFYGKGDGFTLNDGSCACHKRWGWLSNRCESGHCFDYIGNPANADPMMHSNVSTNLHLQNSKPVSKPEITACRICCRH